MGIRDADNFQCEFWIVDVVVLSSLNVRPGRSTSPLGLPHESIYGDETSLLPYVQRIQTRTHAPLLRLQPLRTQHGPPLPVAEQLHRILEPEVFYAHFDLCAEYNPHDRVYSML